MRKANRILIITERFYPEEFGINQIARAWQEKGYEVAVLAQAPSYPFDRVYRGYENRIFQTEDWQGIIIYRVFSLMRYKKGVLLKVMNYLCYTFFASIAALLMRQRFQRVFVYHIGPLTQAIPGVILKKHSKSKLYVWTLDLWPDSVYAFGFRENVISRSILDLFVKFIYRNCEKVFISCKGFAPKIRRYAPKIRIIYSPQWAPDDFEFEKITPHESLNGCFNFTFAGNIGKMQNLENVIKGFALVDKTDRSVRLNIVGDGSNLGNLRRMVKQESISDIHFWGRKPLKEMPRWFEGSDVLIISLTNAPIFSLTVPAKFQAYLASSKPIFCVMNGEVADMVLSNRIGFVAKPDDIYDIKKGFEEFLNTSLDDLRSLTKNMRSLLLAEFDQNKIIQDMTEEIFGEASESRCTH